MGSDLWPRAEGMEGYRKWTETQLIPDCLLAVTDSSIGNAQIVFVFRAWSHNSE